MDTLRQHFWIAFWIGIFFIGYLWSSASSEAHYGDLMRRVFHVPDQVEFAEIRYPQRGTANGIEGIFQLTEAQMNAYQARFNDPAVWHKSLELRRRTFDGPYAPSAFAWKALPSPGLAGNRRIRWGNLSRKKIYKIKNGLMMCVAFRNAPGKRKSDWWYQAPKGQEHRFPLYTPSSFDEFNAIHCADMGRSERPPTLLQSVLDIDNRRLHVTIR